MNDRTFNLLLLLLSFVLIMISVEFNGWLSWLSYPGFTLFFLSVYNLGGIGNEDSWKNYIKQKREENREEKRLKKFLNK